MTMLSLALAPLISLQAAGETAVAIKNDTPETWVIEYPRVIAPYIQDYRRCLNASNRLVSGKADFEIQSRGDVARCEEVSLKAQAKAESVLTNRAATEEFLPSDVAPTFDHIGRIHIARGADLDKQFMMRIQGAERAVDAYERTKPKGLVIELRDASVVKAASEVQQNAQGGAE